MTVEVIFSHSGSMFAYYLGIAEVLQKYDLSDVVFSGTSGGCFPCILLNCERDIRDFFNQILEYIKTNSFKNWDNLIKDFLETYIHEEDIERNQNKFHCKLTKLKRFMLFEKVVVSNWTDKQDFVDCISAACFVPIMSSDNQFYKTYRNEKIIDGFFSGTSSEAITEHKSILFHPNKWRFINPTWLLPSKDTEWLSAMYELGFNDALANIRDIERVLNPIKEKELENDSASQSK